MQVKHDTSRTYAYIASYTRTELKDGRTLLRRVQVDIFPIQRTREIYRRLRKGTDYINWLVPSVRPPVFIIREEINWRE